MAISIQEALQLPVMRHTKLVAGLNGLYNMIKWVTIVEVIDDINRLQEGEFLITTGFGLRESEEKWHHFEKLLSMKKLSGVALYTGFYLREIPESFIEIANENAMPLIEIPTNINFSMITKAILEEIVNNQMKFLEYSLNIHQDLTRLTLGNQGFAAITQTLSKLIHGSVILYNDLYEISHYEIIHENMKLADPGTLLIDNQEIALLPYLDRIVKEKQPAHFTIQNLKIQARPVIADQVNYGSIIAIKETEKWKEMDSIALEHATTVYAIEYLKQRAVEETQIRLQGNFLEKILHQNFKSSPLALERGKKLGFDLTLNQAVLEINIEPFFKDLEHDSSKQIVNQLYQMVYQILDKKNKQFILWNRQDRLILLTETAGINSKSSKQYTIELANEIQNRWRLFVPDSVLKFGIGRNYQDVNKLSQSAREAEYALTFSKLLLKPKSIVHYDDLGLYQILIQMKESGMNLREFYEEHLGKLLNLNRQGADLILTLETYLVHNQSIQTTAAELFIHRHTVKYRLKQIEQKTELDLYSADTRMKLLLAIMAYKFTTFLEEPV